MKELLSMVRTRRRKGFVILAFANYSYLEVLLNWLVAMDRLCIENYVIVSLDKKLHGYLSKKAIPSILSPLEGGLNQLWVKRIEIFRLLIDHGIAFIHSDVDAVWLRNPVSTYFIRPKHDLIISQGTIWPPDVVRDRGFVFCCGFFYLRSSEAAKYFLSEMERDVRRTGDDQVTLNRIVESYGIRWVIDRDHVYGFNYKGTRFLCSKQPITGCSTSNIMKICMLPHHQFQRLHMPDEKAYVKHLRSSKDAKSKLDLFRETDCLFLRPDWQSVDFDVTSLWKLAVASNR